MLRTLATDKSCHSSPLTSSSERSRLDLRKRAVRIKRGRSRDTDRPKVDGHRCLSRGQQVIHGELGNEVRKK